MKSFHSVILIDLKMFTNEKILVSQNMINLLQNKRGSHNTIRTSERVCPESQPGAMTSVWHICKPSSTAGTKTLRIRLGRNGCNCSRHMTKLILSKGTGQESTKATGNMQRNLRRESGKKTNQHSFWREMELWELEGVNTQMTKGEEGTSR